MKLTESQLAAFLPGLRDASMWADALNAAAARFEIHSPERWAAFLAQIAHESAGFTRLEENLSYSAERLLAVWPRRFPTLSSAQPYARAPEKLANRVYAGRLGNGDEASGDGWRYRGRGLIQLTGRANYRAAGRALSLALEGFPDDLLDSEAAALTAAWFWHSRGCNELADDHSDDDDRADFVRICQLVNGGRHGLAERMALWMRAKGALAKVGAMG